MQPLSLNVNQRTVYKALKMGNSELTLKIFLNFPWTVWLGFYKKLIFFSFYTQLDHPNGAVGKLLWLNG